MRVVLPSLPAINRPLLPVKIHFFLFYAATGCGLPFRTVYAKQLGISGSAIGIAFAATSLFRLFTNPVFGIMLDKFKKFRATVAAALIIVSFSHLAMVYIPPASENPLREEQLLCETLSRSIKTDFFTAEQQASESFICPTNCTLKRSLTRTQDENILQYIRQHVLNRTSYRVYNMQREQTTLDDPEDNDTTLRSEAESDVVCYCCHSNDCLAFSCLDNSSTKTISLPVPYVSLQFGLFLGLMLVSASTTTAVIFLMDAICYEILDEKPERYGAQRLFGAVGWGLGGLIGGYLNEVFTKESKEIDYSPCFYVLAILSLVDLIPVIFLEVNNTKYSTSLWKDSRSVLSNAYVITYVTMVFFIGVLSGPIWNYGFWYLEEIGANQLLLGLAHIVDCLVAEVPCFLVAGLIIRKIGFVNCNSLTLLFFGLRYLSFYYMTNPWLALPAGLLHGPTYGLFYASATAFAKQKAAPGAEGTAQAIIAAAFESLGVAVGSVLCGVGFDAIGHRQTFLYISIGSFALLFVNIVLQQLVTDQKSSDDSGIEDKSGKNNQSSSI